jgi:hypothetical protein
VEAGVEDAFEAQLAVVLGGPLRVAQEGEVVEGVDEPRSL